MKADRSLRNKAGIFYLGLGALFLLDPPYNMIDILPNAVGFLLLAVGLHRLSFLSENALRARRFFMVLFVIDSARLCLDLALPYMSPTAILLCSFVFAVAQTVIFVFAVAELFKCFEFLEMRLGCSAAEGIVLKKDKNGGRKKFASAASLRNLTLFTFILHAVGSVVPLLPALVTGEISADGDTGVNWEFVTVILYALCIAASLIMGIVWFIRFFRYVYGIANDSECCTAVCSMSDEVIKNSSVQILNNKMGTVTMLFVLASAFCFNMYVDGVNIFPTFIGAFLLMAFFVLLREYSRGISNSGITVSALWAVISFVSEILQYDYSFVNNYTPASADHMIGRSPELYARIEICSYAEAAMLAISFVLAYKLLRIALRTHINSYGKYFSSKQTREQLAVFERVVLAAVILWLVTVGTSIAVFPVMKFFPEIWLIAGLAAVVFTVLVIWARNILCDRIYKFLHE